MMSPAACILMVAIPTPVLAVGPGVQLIRVGELHSAGGVFRDTILKFTWVDWVCLEHDIVSL